MAGMKSGKINQYYKYSKGNSLFLGIGIGAIFLVLAEICCLLAEIYYMLSYTGNIVVIIISALLLLAATGMFLYIVRNTLLKRIEEQQQTYERLLRLNKIAYGKMEERDERLYNRQLSIAKAQVKRTRESVMNMVRANEYIIDEIEEKLGKDSVLQSYGESLREVQDSVAQIRELCERIAAGQANPAEEAQEVMPEMIPEPEKPFEVDIEPLPEEVLETLETSVEEELEELLPEIEEEEPEEVLPEIEEEEPEEVAPEIEETDPGQMMSAEDIAALFNNM